MYANSVSDTRFDENLAHSFIRDVSVTSQTYSTDASPPTPSAVSADAQYVFFGSNACHIRNSYRRFWFSDTMR